MFVRVLDTLCMLIEHSDDLVKEDNLDRPPTRSCSSNDQWYVVHCKPRKEKFTSSILQGHLGLGTFLPEICSKFEGEIRQVPFFPGYIFVLVDLQQISLSRINRSPGVIRILDFGEGPQPVPSVVIEALYEEVNRVNILSSAPNHDLCSGDRVRIKSGPLQGLEAAFTGTITPSKRAWVLIHFLGRLKEVQVGLDTLEKVPNPPTLESRRERSTRGKGRRIG